MINIKPAIEATIRAFCDQIDNELQMAIRVLANLSNEGLDINVDTYKIPLPYQVERSQIRAKKDIETGKPIYRYHDTKFNLDKNTIIDMLMGEKMYTRSEIALRELLQNSIDACLARQKLSETHNIEYTPKIKVELYTENDVDYLRVSDNGIGMNMYIIDHYYTNVGCSYYSSREFRELMAENKSQFIPISRFGIGILSCFMVCDSMEVTTRKTINGFDCDEALSLSIEGKKSLFVIRDSDKKEPGTDTVLMLHSNHPWKNYSDSEFIQHIKSVVPNPAVQIEIKTRQRKETYFGDYFENLSTEDLLDYSWKDVNNVQKIEIDLSCEEYGFKGKGCIGIITQNGSLVEKIETTLMDVPIADNTYTMNSGIEYRTNYVVEKSTKLSVKLLEDGKQEMMASDSGSVKCNSQAALSIHGIEVTRSLFPDIRNTNVKEVLRIPFPFSFRLDIGAKGDLNLNSARDQIIYDEKWLAFEENLYRVICRRLKEMFSPSEWKILYNVIQKSDAYTFKEIANSMNA